MTCLKCANQNNFDFFGKYGIWKSKVFGNRFRIFSFSQVWYFNVMEKVRAHASPQFCEPFKCDFRMTIPNHFSFDNEYSFFIQVWHMGMIA